MAKVVVKQKVKKVKRKFPVEFKAPEYLNSVSLGNTQVTDLNALAEKSIKMNLMYVTGNAKNQNVRLVFKILDVTSGAAKTQVSNYSQIPYYLGRFVKKGSDLIEDSFVAKTKDGIDVRIKPFIVTKMNTSSLTLGLLRSKAKEIITKDVASKTYDDFMASVIFGKEQNVYRNELRKLFPLKAFEFRMVGME